jgi:hypothetical protein
MYLVNSKRFFVLENSNTFYCQKKKNNSREKLKIFNSINKVLRTAFSNPIHISIASIVGLIFWVVTNMFDNILFFSPFLAFYVPSDMMGMFLLSCINAILVGILVNISLHIMRNLKLKISRSALSGTTISIISSTCVSCSTFAFTIASTFGALGFAVSDFLAANQTILREISTIILLFAVFVNFVKIRNNCDITPRYQIDRNSTQK